MFPLSYLSLWWVVSLLFLLLSSIRIILWVSCVKQKMHLLRLERLEPPGVVVLVEVDLAISVAPDNKLIMMLVKYCVSSFWIYCVLWWVIYLIKNTYLQNGRPVFDFIPENGFSVPGPEWPILDVVVIVNHRVLPKEKPLKRTATWFHIRTTRSIIMRGFEGSNKSLACKVPWAWAWPSSPGCRCRSSTGRRSPRAWKCWLQEGMLKKR